MAHIHKRPDDDLLVVVLIMILVMISGIATLVYQDVTQTETYYCQERSKGNWAGLDLDIDCN